MRGLPKSFEDKGQAISSYFFFFTNAFERMFVAAQTIRTGVITPQLDFRDGILFGLISWAGFVAEKSQLPFVGCISIFSAMVVHQKRTAKANAFITFSEFFHGESRDQYLLTYRKLAEQICLQLHSSSLENNDLSEMENYRKRLNAIIAPIKEYLRNVHLITIEKLTWLEARAMSDLSLITHEVLRLHQNAQATYLVLCSSDESTKASYFVDILFCSQLDNKTATNILSQTALTNHALREIKVRVRAMNHAN